MKRKNDYFNKCIGTVYTHRRHVIRHPWVTLLLSEIVQQMPKKAGTRRTFLAYYCAIAASSLLLILLPILVLSSEIVPTAVGFYRKDTPELADLLEHYENTYKHSLGSLSSISKPWI